MQNSPHDPSQHNNKATFGNEIQRDPLRNKLSNILCGTKAPVVWASALAPSRKLFIIFRPKHIVFGVFRRHPSGFWLIKQSRQNRTR